MKRLLPVLVACLWETTIFAADDAMPEIGPAPAEISAASAGKLDGTAMEKDLQNLNWNQFRSVIEAVPKMKADVDAYGPLGWQYVKQNYATHGWKKSIDRLDPTQKQQLADLINTAKQGKKPVAVPPGESGPGVAK